MTTRIERLTQKADQMSANVALNLAEWKHAAGQSIVQQVKEQIEIDLTCFGEADPIAQEHYLAGTNYDKALVMLCITGDHKYLPQKW